MQGCPYCGYCITEEQWLNLRYDFPCPKCNVMVISDFITVVDVQKWHERYHKE